MDRSICDLSFVVTPIFMTRLVDDTGGIMTGGAAQVGMPRVAMATRSVTSCRAANSSAPRSKIASHGRELRNRTRPQDLDTRHAVHRILDRDRDLLLHLGRRKPNAERLHLHSRRREFRKDIDRNLFQPLGPEIGKAETQALRL